MKKTFYILIFSFNTILLLIVLLSNCSREIPSSYDEIEKNGRIESIARKNYSKFFQAIEKFEISFADSDETAPDSTLIKKASQLTDRLIEDIHPFPSTLESRIAIDALSYAANDLATSPGFNKREISNFWEYAFIKPLFSFAKNYMKANNINESAHLQLIKALRRSMSSKATDEMVVDCIFVVGVVPSKKVMEYCKTDTLVFKKIHDLLIYTRSLQKVDPPLWMLSGAWFLAIEFEGLPTIFISLVPSIIDDVPYLSFKDYTQGEVYSAVFDDPVPTDKSKWDAWLARANAVMSSLIFNSSIVERVNTSGLPTYDAHNFYDDYLFHSEIDTTKKVFCVSFVRKKDQIDTFQFTGMDSIAVILGASQFTNPDSDIIMLFASRNIGASMNDNQFFKGQAFIGNAYLMPLGAHDKNKIDEYQKIKMPEMEVKVSSPDN